MECPVPLRLLKVNLPGLLLVTLSNQRESWVSAWRRSKAQRGSSRLLLDAALSKLARDKRPKPPLLIFITRVTTGNMLDHDDNVNNSCKHVKDSVADALGIDDRNPLVSWRFAQERGKVPAAIVEMFERLECPCCGGYVEPKS